MRGYFLPLALLAAPFASAESEFNYSALSGALGIVTVYFEDLDQELTGAEATVGVNKELAPNVFGGLGISFVGVSDTLTVGNVMAEVDIRTTTLTGELGAYFSLNPRFDVFGTIGLGYTKATFEAEYRDTLGYGYSASETVEDTLNSVGVAIGARMYLDRNSKVELTPVAGISESEGDTSASYRVSLRFNVSESLDVGAYAATTPADDIDSFGILARVHL